MKNFILAIMLVLGLGTMATAQEPVTPDEPTICEGMNFEMLLGLAKEMEVPVIVIQGEGLDKFAKVVKDNTGIDKPAEIAKIVMVAADVEAFLNGTTNVISGETFQADGCKYGGGTATFSGSANVGEALRAALGKAPGQPL